MSKKQLYLLKAIIQGASQLTSTRVMSKFDLGTARNLAKNRDVLLKSDTIHSVEGDCEFLDPAFEPWFRKMYFNQDYLF